MKKFWSDSSSTGKLAIFIGLFVLAPLLILPWYPEDAKYALSFLIPGGGAVLFGILLCLFARRDAEAPMDWRSQLGRSSLTVLFAWGFGVLIGALPFVIGGQLRFIPALFEAVSGWTTTGLSAMDVSVVPMIYLFHRSFMQYCGGLGFILMMIIFISNKQSMNLYSAEGHPDRIMPNIKKTAQAIFIVYNIFLVIGSIAYRLAGMDWFDSICHCMCSLSTGGFSTKLMSIGHYDSLAIEIITIVLMLIGTTNFAALLLLAKGRIRSFFRVSEVKFMFILLAIFIPPTAVSLANAFDVSLWEGLRIASFDVVSALSTTGYSTMSYADWPEFAVGVLIVMMIIGGGVGSTAGGLKISRVYLTLRMCGSYIKKKLSPNSKIAAPEYVKASGKTPIDKEVAEDTTAFVIAYFVIYVIGTLALTVTADCTLTEAMFDFASSLSTVGLSIGITGPTTNDATLIVEMIGMLLGRLEIFIVVIGFTFGFARLKSLFKRKRA